MSALRRLVMVRSAKLAKAGFRSSGRCVRARPIRLLRTPAVLHPAHARPDSPSYRAAFQVPTDNWRCPGRRQSMAPVAKRLVLARLAAAEVDALVLARLEPGWNDVGGFHCPLHCQLADLMTHLRLPGAPTLEDGHDRRIGDSTDRTMAGIGCRSAGSWISVNLVASTYVERSAPAGMMRVQRAVLEPGAR